MGTFVYMADWMFEDEDLFRETQRWFSAEDNNINDKDAYIEDLISMAFDKIKDEELMDDAEAVRYIKTKTTPTEHGTKIRVSEPFATDYIIETVEASSMIEALLRLMHDAWKKSKEVIE